MASYVESVLSKDEKVLYEGKISMWSLMGYFIAGIVTITIGIGVLFFIAAFIKYKTTELAITNKRIIAKTGFISRKSIEMNLHKVETVQVDQNILGRMLNYGSLVISGAGNPQAPISGISDPMAFRRAFSEVHDNIHTQSTQRVVVPV
jgi:uncharacterized membrane protein YdbT with pleckstrin-like domain